MMKKNKVLITVKTYPTISKTYGELSCTAGITDEGNWIRIYPIPFRRLKEKYRFEKYRWISLELEKNSKDKRPESYRPVDLSSIETLGKVETKGNWKERKKILNQVKCFTDLKELIAKAKSGENSLAFFKPSEVLDFYWEKENPDWNSKKVQNILAELKQGKLFPEEEFIEKEFKIVDKLPYKFKYKFKDSSGVVSNMMIEDWEVGMLFWNCKKKYIDDEIALSKVKEKYFDNFVNRRDLHFFLGTTSVWHNIAPNPFLIIGTFTPPKELQKELF